MTSSINRVTLIGYLGKDPDIRVTERGMKIANMSLATSDSWNDKNTGEKREATEWHRIVVMGEKLVTFIESTVHKGARCFVEGKLQTREWTDKEGNKRHTTQVMINSPDSKFILLGRKDETQEAMMPANHGRQAEPKRREPMPDLEDDVPF